MTGMVGGEWSLDNFSPMDAIPAAVQVGKTFRLDEIVEAHRSMEENKAGGKIVVLT